MKPFSYSYSPSLKIGQDSYSAAFKPGQECHFLPLRRAQLHFIVLQIKQMNSEVDRHYGMAPVMAPSETIPTSSAMGPSVAASSPSKGTPAPVRGLGWFISAAKAGGKDTVPVASSTNVGSGQNKGLRRKGSVREIKPWIIGEAAQKVGNFSSTLYVRLSIRLYVYVTLAINFGQSSERPQC